MREAAATFRYARSMQAEQEGVHRVEIPGLEGPLEVQEPSLVRGLVVRHHGQVVSKKSFFGRSYVLPGANGSPIELEVWADGLRGVVQVRGAGIERVLGEPIPMWLAVAAAIPFLLAAVGGALGGVIGAIAWSLNRAIAGRRDLHVVVRLGAMAALSGVAVLAWIVAATVFSLLLHGAS